MTKVLRVSKNIMGTTSIIMKLKGMRKEQEFTVYPITKESEQLILQSDTRIAKVALNGVGLVSKSHQGGAYFPHLDIDKLTEFTFEQDDWQIISAHIGLMAGEDVGDSFVKTDNSGAKSIFNL